MAVQQVRNAGESPLCTLMSVVAAPSDRRRLRASSGYVGSAYGDNGGSDRSMIISIGVAVAGKARLHQLLSVLARHEAWSRSVAHQLESAGALSAAFSLGSLGPFADPCPAFPVYCVVLLSLGGGLSCLAQA